MTGKEITQVVVLSGVTWGALEIVSVLLGRMSVRDEAIEQRAMERCSHALMDLAARKVRDRFGK